ncbi:MAG: OPT/YSL family transporter [Deltaproteobacteria bacterium]|nr:OPT/YSL family transporter [Deltaproteobacteria bacterium]
MSDESPEAAESSEPAPEEAEATPAYPPVNTTDPQLTFRAIATGMFFGGLLSLCNIYSGLKIGWGFNMSITAMLLSFGLYKSLEKVGARPYGMLENNINQTAASAGANISSAGLVAPIPALTILTGEQLGWGVLAAWTLAVSLVGIVVGIGLRRQMLIVDELAFPAGIASAETIKQMYARGSEAMARVKALLAGALFGGGAKALIHFAKIKKLLLPGSMNASGAAAGAGITKYTLPNLGFVLDWSPLMVAVGALIGIRAGWSMLLGAIVAWGYLAPMALDAGWAEPGAAEAGAVWFGSLNKWMLWPGVSMMVTAALTSFAFSWKSVVAAIRGTRKAATSDAGESQHDVPRQIFLGALVAVLILATLGQVFFFEIGIGLAISAVLLTFVLAIVAGRVSGETGITPVGPMGKVTQLIFGVVSPGNVSSNLMAANVTGGAASQTADMLHDMKTGLLIGASPKFQAVAQTFGVVAGATIGSWGYLLLIPDPQGMLLTEEWAAPAVLAWKTVAELFRDGIEAMPEMAPMAMAVGGGLGVVLAVLEKVLSKEKRKFVPSPSAMGLALVIPAYYAISMFLGGLISVVAERVNSKWAKRFVIVIAAGIIAGESLVGVGIAIYQTLTGIAG